MTQKGNIIIPLLSGAFVVALLTAGYLFWQNQQLQSSNLSTLTPVPTVTAKQNDTTNWISYRNEIYNYTFDHPEDYHVNSYNRGGTEWVYVIKRLMKEEDFMGLTHGLPGALEILTQTGDDYSTYGADKSYPYTLKTAGGTPYATMEKINFHGVTAYQESQFGTPDIPTGAPQNIIRFVRNNALITISYPNRNNKDYSAIHDQILATFRFINTPLVNTYLDPKYRFEFNYPQGLVLKGPFEEYGSTVYYVWTKEFAKECDLHPCTHNFASLWIYLTNIEIDEDLEDYLRKHDGSTPELKQVDYLGKVETVNLKNGISSERLTGLGEGSFSWKFYDKGKQLLISFEFSDPNDKIPHDIISTFKFL